MKTTILQDQDWFRVLSLLPEDLEESAIAKLAIARYRQVQSASDLLRICLAYGVCDLSLRQTAAWASTIGLGELSNVAVLKRLRAASDWLGHLVGQWLTERGLTANVPARRVRIVDASTVCSPGKSGNYRIHASFDLEQMRMVDVEVSDVKVGETFRNFKVHKDEILLGDRGYGTRGGIASVLEQNGHVVVRVHWRTMPLETKGGKPLDTLALLETLDADEMGDWPVYIRHDDKRYCLRLVAIRKSRAATEKAQKELRRKAQKRGYKPDARSLKAAAFTYVLSDLDVREAPTIQVLELYRLRWQIELVFKRIKSLLTLNLRAKDEDLARAYLLANILGALIVEELSGQALSFFPWGFRLSKTSCKLLANV